MWLFLSLQLVLMFSLIANHLKPCNRSLIAGSHSCTLHWNAQNMFAHYPPTQMQNCGLQSLVMILATSAANPDVILDLWNEISLKVLIYWFWNIVVLLLVAMMPLLATCGAYPDQITPLLAHPLHCTVLPHSYDTHAVNCSSASCPMTRTHGTGHCIEFHPIWTTAPPPSQYGDSPHSIPTTLLLLPLFCPPPPRHSRAPSGVFKYTVSKRIACAMPGGPWSLSCRWFCSSFRISSRCQACPPQLQTVPHESSSNTLSDRIQISNG